MDPPDFSLEQLKALPLRAIVAFAARCARRVEPLAQLPEGHPQRERRREAIVAALGVAESFARGEPETPDESVVRAVDASRGIAGGPSASGDAVAATAEAAQAAADAWRLTSALEGATREAPKLKPSPAPKPVGPLTSVAAEAVVLDAFMAAADAFLSLGDPDKDLMAAARNDYETLLRLELGRYPEPGAPVDPSPDGPLGPLGPQPQMPRREVA